MQYVTIEPSRLPMTNIFVQSFKFPYSNTTQ